MGRPNWTRSRAWVRASSSMARPAADELVPEGELAQRQRGRPVGDARRCHAVELERAGDLEQAQCRIEALHRRDARAGAAGRRSPRRRRPLRATTSTRSQRSSVADGQSVAPGTAPRRDARRARSGAAVAARLRSRRLARPERAGQQPVERGRVGGRRPLAFEEHRDGGGPVGLQRVAPPELVEGGVERGTVGGRRGAAGRRPRTARARRPPSAVGSEVEEAPGDDVALDLGAAAVDGGST